MQRYGRSSSLRRCKTYRKNQSDACDPVGNLSYDLASLIWSRHLVTPRSSNNPARFDSVAGLFYSNHTVCLLVSAARPALFPPSDVTGIKGMKLALLSQIIHSRAFPSWPKMSLCGRAYLLADVSKFWYAWYVVFGPEHCVKSYVYWRRK